MDRDELVRLTRESGLNQFGLPVEALERFAALVAAAELQRARQIVVDGAIAAAVAAEREACAEIVADNLKYLTRGEALAGIRVRSIRARGAK